MKYTVEILPPAQKVLKSIDSRYVEKIKEKIDLLETNPKHNGCIKLTGVDAYRTRLGKYRIIYKIFEEKVLVVVINIDHRKDIYR